jgi:PAS domain S-box-containing protein
VRRTSDTLELFSAIEISPIAAIITDPRLPDNPICAANRAFEALTGYSTAELIGRNCRLLVGPDTDPAASRRLSRAIAEGRAEFVQLRNYRRDGSSFVNAVMIAPFFDDAGALAHFVGSQMDVTSRLQRGPRDRSADRKGLGDLTPRQRQVLALMARGLRNKQIAAQLGIGEKTVKMHRAAMIARLGVTTSVDALRLAVEAGL